LDYTCILGHNIIWPNIQLSIEDFTLYPPFLLSPLYFTLTYIKLKLLFFFSSTCLKMFPIQVNLWWYINVFWLRDIYNILRFASIIMSFSLRLKLSRFSEYLDLVYWIGCVFFFGVWSCNHQEIIFIQHIILLLLVNLCWTRKYWKWGRKKIKEYKFKWQNGPSFLMRETLTSL